MRCRDHRRPTQNGKIERFNARLREEFLNEHWFVSMDELRADLAAWRLRYNTQRPQGGLNYLTPTEFARRFAELSIDTTPQLQTV